MSEDAHECECWDGWVPQEECPIHGVDAYALRLRIKQHLWSLLVSVIGAALCVVAAWLASRGARP